MDGLFPRQPTIVAPGAVHLPGWLDGDGRRALALSCAQWAESAGGMRSPRMPRGGVMSVQITCLGWHWLPYRYSRTVDDGDGRPVPEFPPWLGDLSRRGVADASAVDPGLAAEGGPGLAAEGGPDGDPIGAVGYAPDVALVNWYGPGARMGMHADRDEKSRAPVVSLSLGQSCVFRFGSPAGRGRPWSDVVLASGDLFVFGGPSRLAYHGVPKLIPDSSDPEILLGPGRFNVTIRESGLGGSP